MACIFVKPLLPQELLLTVRAFLLRRRLEAQALRLTALCQMAKAVNSSLHLNAVRQPGLEHAITSLATDAFPTTAAAPRPPGGAPAPPPFPHDPGNR